MKLVSKKTTKSFNGIAVGYKSPRWTREVTDCSLPMTLDTYSVCSYGCVYCIAQFFKGINDTKQDYFDKKVWAVDPDKIKKLFNGEIPNSQFNTYIKKRMVLQWGGLADQFDEFERKYGVTLELLKYFRTLEYPITFSTKATWFLDDERYKSVIQDMPWNCKFSIVTANDDMARLFERGVDSPSKRLDAIGKWADISKGGATLRLRPFIPGISTDYLDLIEKAYNKGATAVSTEFYCIEPKATPEEIRNYRYLSDIAGFDLFDFYKRNSDGIGHLRLNRTIKRKVFKEMKELCDRLGMRFYISDAGFKELSNNCCCCGLPPDWNVSRGNFSEALQIAKRKGYVHFSDISCNMEHLEFPYSDAMGFNTGATEKRSKFKYMTMKEYLRYEWNNPNITQSPYKMFGRVLLPDGLDENGDVIYKFNPSVSMEEYLK